MLDDDGTLRALLANEVDPDDNSSDYDLIIMHAAVRDENLPPLRQGDEAYPLLTALFLEPSLKPAYSAFVESFHRVNDRNQGQHAIDAQQFFIIHQLVMLQLAEIMGSDVFRYLRNQLATTVLTLERFIESIPLLPLVF